MNIPEWLSSISKSTRLIIHINWIRIRLFKLTRPCFYHIFRSLDRIVSHSQMWLVACSLCMLCSCLQSMLSLRLEGLQTVAFFSAFTMERFVCNLCNNSYNRFNDFEKHVRKHKQAILCRICNWVVKGEDQSNHHVRIIHGPRPRPYKCPVKNCRSNFPEQWILLSHMREQHPEVNLTCKT